MLESVAEWHDAINRETGRSGVGGNKLRIPIAYLNRRMKRNNIVKFYYP